MRRSVASRRRQAVFLWLFALLALAATTSAEPVAPRRLRQAQQTTDTGVVTVGPADAATSIDDGTHTWELVDAQPTTAPVGDASSSHSGSTHEAHLDFQEKLDAGKASAATTAPSSSASSSSSSTAAATHHSTPMMGYIVVGAMAIVCVGIAAGVAKRKREAAGNH